MCHYNGATRWKIPNNRTGTIRFRKVHLVISDIGNYFPIPLTGGFTGSMNIHCKVSYTAVVVKVDHGMADAHSGKTVHFIAC